MYQLYLKKYKNHPQFTVYKDRLKAGFDGILPTPALVDQLIDHEFLCLLHEVIKSTLKKFFSLKTNLLKKEFYLLFWLCCEGFYLVAGSEDCSLVAMGGLMIVVASLVGEYRLQGVWASVIGAGGLSSYRPWALEHRLNSCGAGAQLFCSCSQSSWARGLIGRFFTTEPLGKSKVNFFSQHQVKTLQHNICKHLFRIGFPLIKVDSLLKKMFIS